MKEMLGGCCVCADENGWITNPLVYCDGPNCEVAVHQGCYGIVEVPEGEWYCAKCADMISQLGVNGSAGNSGALDVRDPPRCELCPYGNGALKKTDAGGWVHVICALYIPEVRFGNVHSMDPVIINDVPLERFHQPCYLCSERGDEKRALQGACMSCNKSGCKKGFHVTCAQAEGLLCEEGGGSKNVKYCGYCMSHANKMIGDPLIKAIPAYRHRTLSSSCSSSTSCGASGASGTIAISSTNIAVINQQISPQLSNAGSDCINGTASSSVGHTSNQILVPNIAPSANSAYGGRVCTFLGKSGNTLSLVSANDVFNQDIMLVDSMRRGPIQPSQIDCELMNSFLTQPVGNHMVLEERCCNASSSNTAVNSVQNNRTSGTHCAASPGISHSGTLIHPTISVTSNMKADSSLSLADVVQSSLPIVSLPSNLLGIPTSPKKIKLPASISSENLIPTSISNGMTGNQMSHSPNFSFSIPLNSKLPTMSTPSFAASAKQMKRMKGNDSVERSTKKARVGSSKGSTSGKTVEELLESVGPLVSEIVTNFQRERVSERDAAAAALAASGTSAMQCESGENVGQEPLSMPSTSSEPNMGQHWTTEATAQGSTASSSVNVVDLSSPSTSHRTQFTNPAAGLIGPPLLRSKTYLPEYLQSIDRHHVSTSTPSTSSNAATLTSASQQQQQQQPLAFPQTMEELLERQWEQGSNCIMGSVNFDVAKLLSCLYQLKMENNRLTEHVTNLTKRRDHLLTVNARLSASLAVTSTSQTASPTHSPRVSTTNVTVTVTSGMHATQPHTTSTSYSGSMGTAPIASSFLGGTQIPPLVTSTLLQQQQQQQMQKQQQLHHQQQPRPQSAHSTSAQNIHESVPQQQSFPSSSVPLLSDDPLHQLRTLAGTSGLGGIVTVAGSGGGSITPTRNVMAGMTSLVQNSQPQQQQILALGGAATIHSPKSVTPVITSTSGGTLSQSSSMSYITNRMQSTGNNSSLPIATTPSGLQTPGLPAAPKSALGNIDLLNASQTAASSSMLTGGRQQQQHMAAAAGNVMGSGFLASRPSGQLGTSSQHMHMPQIPAELLYLMQQQIFQQQYSSVAAALRFCNMGVPSSNPTPPTTSNPSTSSLTLGGTVTTMSGPKQI